MAPHPQTSNPRHESPSAVRRLAGLLRPYLPRLSLALAAQIALALINMLPAAIPALLLNHIFPEHNWALLWILLGGVLAYYILRNVLFHLSKFTVVRVGEHLCFTLRNRLFENLQQMSLGFYQRNQPGKVSSRVMNDSFVIQTFIQDDAPKLIQNALMFLVALAIIFAMSWKLAIVSVIVLPLHLVVYHVFRRPIKKASGAAQEQLATVQGNLIEKILGAEVVKGFTAEDREKDSFRDAIDQSRQSQLRSKHFHVIQKNIADFLIGLGLVLLIGFGAYQVLQGQMIAGTFISFYAYVWMLYPAVMELINGVAKLTRCSACVDRVFDILEHPADFVDGSRRGVPIAGRLKFQNVSFRYGDGPPVLKNVSMEIPAGRVCAIVGPSGSGKSTLVSLVPRFIDPGTGRVFVDDIPVDEYTIRHLRQSIGVAFQECFLFNSSIFENLRYARPDATMNQIIEVAKRTGAHEFIARMPSGYGTILGEEGMSLSRGQKQRITLTRAMLKNPRILILDEATASIDSPSEGQIIPAILEFMKGKTTLMITHRPELLKHADVVLHLNEGRVDYMGTPDHMPPDVILSDPDDQPVDPPQPARPTGGAWRPLAAWLLIAALTCAALFNNTAHAQDAAAPARPTGHFIAQPGLSPIEIEELIFLAITHAKIQLGYRNAGDAIAETLPSPGVRLQHVQTLARSDGDTLHLLQIGYQFFRSQPPHIWAAGITQTDAATTANADLTVLEKLFNDSRAQLDAQTKALKPADLATQKINLSYADAARCLEMLKVFGYTVAAPGSPVNPQQVPVVMQMPPTQLHKLVGGGDPKSAKFKDFPLTDSDPINDLIVFYNPAKPEQYSQVLDKVRTLIDVPARQIMIEAMVLEIAETGLEKLGVKWELESPGRNITDVVIGRVPAFTSSETPTLEIGLTDVFGEFRASIDALIREGEAEILSRPHVLTLDNRMAYFNVARRIPVVTSVSAPNSGTFTVSFAEKVAGITLNVRPRVSANGEEISMQVVAAVTNEVPNEDVVVENSLGDEIARSPTIAEREVRTYTRIANNTPFIIGGLIARDDLTDRDKVPLLGDIPIVGELLFQNRDNRKLRREVIIVITPYVLPEDQVIGRNLPKDKDAFDSFGHKLFRDAYRIRAEDVFDLTFLYENQYLIHMRGLADRVIRRNFTVADRYPFNKFAGGRIPGEEILVYRQMYEVIKRLGSDETVDPQLIIFLVSDDQSEKGFTVRYLQDYLAEAAGLEPPRDPDARSRFYQRHDVEDLFDRLDGRALALTYTLRSAASVQSILSQPVPAVSIIEVEADDWGEQLWQLNQPDDDGHERCTILLREPADLTRLKRALLLKQTVQLNASRQTVSLRNFSIGRLLLMPSVAEEKVHLIDADTARYFFLTEHYYPAFRDVLTRDIERLKSVLTSDRYRRYTTNAPKAPSELLNLPENLEP